MKRLLIFCIGMLTAMHVVAVQTTVSGTVRSGLTGKPLAQVSVQAVMEAPLEERGERREESGELQTPPPTPPRKGRVQRGASVVTNDDGVFTLKSNGRIVAVVVSAVGYATQRVAVGSKPLDIRLQPATVQLREVTVWTGNARELVTLALQRIADNYSAEGELAACFYRETAMKRQHYVYVAEGVVDMYKGRYSQPNVNRDRVAIRKGRRLMSPKRGDTLTVKVTGGPVQSIMLDIVKNRELLLNPEELENYDFQLLEPQTIDDRQQLVVGIEPRGYVNAPYALYHGRLYIDHETLAITRAELELDMNNREKATSVMLVRKPAGLRFRPRELSLVADYRMGADGRCRLSYVRTRFRFNCDWKRRLFATSFTATCELVVTDREAVAPGERPITGRQSFDSRDAFYDKVDFFRDPDFWRDYNIIEPTESLDRAIDRLLRRYK